MLYNNLKLAFRLLIKNRAYSLISIIGIGVGLGVCLLIGLYIQNEISYDRYHKNSDRLFRLANHVAGATYENGIAKVSGPWGLAAEEEIPEVEQAARFVFFWQALFSKAKHAAPLAWLAANRWLNSYAYRSSIEWWYFVAAGLLAVLIALISISYHSLRAALANPVDALRYE